MGAELTLVLDAQALIGLVLDEPQSDGAARAVRDNDAAMSALNFAEAVDVLLRRGYSGSAARLGLRTFVDAGVEMRAVDEPVAWRAGELRSRHYHRARSPLSLADCVALASCRPGEALATGDASLLQAAAAEGIETAPL